jgi:hypothetical protein
MLYRTGFELTTLVMIGTGCTGSCQSNYHTITTTMMDSFECIVGGYPCIINKHKEDDRLAKYVKRLRDISFYHGCNQESTMETLDLVKYKLEDLKELQSFK